MENRTGQGCTQKARFYIFYLYHCGDALPSGMAAALVRSLFAAAALGALRTASGAAGAAAFLAGGASASAFAGASSGAGAGSICGPGAVRGPWRVEEASGDQGEVGVRVLGS